MHCSSVLCVSDYFRLQDVAADCVRVSLQNSKHVIVKLKSNNLTFNAEHVRPVEPDTEDKKNEETDITALWPADQQHFVPPKFVPLQNYLSEQQILDRVKGVVQCVKGKRRYGKIATLKHGAVSVNQSDVIGGGLLHVGQLCNFNITFSKAFDRQATFVLAGPEAERCEQELYRQAAKQVDLKVEREMGNPESAASFEKYTKDVIAAMKRSAINSVEDHASEIAVKICRKRKRD